MPSNRKNLGYYSQNKIIRKEKKVMELNKNKVLEKIADDLNLSDTELDNIITSYEAVGTLLNNDTTISLYGDVRVFPQGSIALGTTVKPLSNSDYDVDMVALVLNNDIDLRTLKGIIGDALKKSDRYRNRIQKLPNGGKRCWTLNYKDYHMDILPCKPDPRPATYKDIKSVIATHTDDGFTFREVYTNPKGYLSWFLDKSNSYLEESKRLFSLEKIKEYPRKTALQKIVQLIKRHRDVYFGSQGSLMEQFKPISIIITTLAANAYRGETDLLIGLSNVVNGMKTYISKDSFGKYSVINPVNTKENFADKWNDNSQKASYFFKWYNQLVKDINELKTLTSIDFGNRLKALFGKENVENVYKYFGDISRKERESGSLKMDKKSGAINSVTGVAVAAHTFFGGNDED